MTNYRLILEYDGTDFEGWQSQSGDRRTVQGCLADAVERITGERVQPNGSGRTDSGVHAEGQVANVKLAASLAPAELQRALNAVLPLDLVVRALDAVPENFDARRDALSKRYRYRIWNGPWRSPHRARTHLFVPRRLDFDAMQRAAQALVGTHDFASFQASGSSVKTSVRTVTRLQGKGAPGGEIVFDVEGSGFLRHMVRNIVGTLLEVGQGQRTSGSMEALLAARDRRQAGITAPPMGLCLMRVDYAVEAAADTETRPHSA